MPGSVLLDATRPEAVEGERLLFADPVRQLEAHSPAEVRAALQQAGDALAAGYHVAGFVSYEAGAALLEEPTPHRGAEPLLALGIFQAPERIDQPHEASGSAREIGACRPTIGRAAYEQAVGSVKEAIREGDVYQINFTFALDFSYAGDPWAIYGALRERQRVSYGAFIPRPDGAVLSFSPELFFRTEAGRIVARPMKGTARRGRDAAEDARLKAWLRADEKNRAENLMIVDLLRNDLARVCEVGTVEVPALYSIETYETLHQMTSTVAGRLRPDASLTRLFEALFPCGSVTGAPKRSAMRLIERLEAEPRGVYCGAIGYAAPDGRAAFNVAIRTLVLRGGTGRMGVGSGIVWDSDWGAEYEECLLKGAFLSDVRRET
jgi:para-aminobenzoate synthetase/4-amino-4-deoxychorismate lyase